MLDSNTIKILIKDAQKALKERHIYDALYSMREICNEIRYASLRSSTDSLIEDYSRMLDYWEKGVSDAMETTLIMPEKESATLPEKVPDTPAIDYVTPMDAFTAVVAVRPQENCTYAFYRAASESGDYTLVSTRDEPFLYDEHKDKNIDWFYRVRAVRADKESEMSQQQKTGYNTKTAFSVPALMYHEFVTEEDLKSGIVFDEYAVYADEFESDLQWIQKNGYTTITTAPTSTRWRTLWQATALWRSSCRGSCSTFPIRR